MPKPLRMAMRKMKAPVNPWEHIPVSDFCRAHEAGNMYETVYILRGGDTWGLHAACGAHRQDLSRPVLGDCVEGDEVGGSVGDVVYGDDGKAKVAVSLGEIMI